jgi:pilus assembly protein CpaB
MNSRTILVSAIFAVVAVFFMWSYITSLEEETRRRNGTEVLVLVAKRDILEMETINETMVEFTLIPKKFIEPSSISLDARSDSSDSAEEEQKKERTSRVKRVAGNIAVVPIKKGEQITDNKMSEPGGRTGLATQVTPGRRAYSIPISDLSGVSKLIKPGDRVDLITVVDLGGGKETKVAKTVFQDVVVLATGRYIANNVARSVEIDPMGGKDKIKSLADDFSFSTITVEVEPAQVQTLALLLNNSDNAFSIALRNNEDLERVNVPMSNLADVVGADAIARAKSQGSKR